MTAANGRTVRTGMAAKKRAKNPAMATEGSTARPKPTPPPQVRQPTEELPTMTGNADVLESERRTPGFPVAGIGASAGGLDAFERFFGAMPADSGVAFVLIPHLDPKHESLMVELVARYTKMPVVEATEGLVVQANRVYILPPNKYMTISGGALRLTGPVERNGPQTSIDLFLRSLATDKQEKAICIILSGTGSHGSLGLKAVKASDGMAMVQEPSTAEYPRMPESAIATGLVDYVLPVEQMPEALIKYIQNYCIDGVKTGAEGTEVPDYLNQVLALLRARTKFDFRCYRKRMLTRRIERRMSLNHINQITDYLAFLREQPDEAKQLFRDLLISVTNFFRDPEAWQALETEVIAPLVGAKEFDAPLRVWSAGCATGEETYSLGIVLLEHLAAAKKSCQIQIFASDVDEEALEVARQGTYPESISTDVSHERLARFFTHVDDAYHVSKMLRELVIFARQNLISDAPFSKLDLIVCRNLLIYLEPEVQKKVISLLHFSLNEGGFLFLGPSETIGRNIDLFEPVSKKWRIFRRIGPVRPQRVEIPIAATLEPLVPVRRSMPPSTTGPVNFANMTHRLLLDQFAPAAVLVNRKYEILYFFGATDRYLAVPAGEPTQDLLMMAREGLRTKLRSTTHKAVREGGPVTLAVQVKRNGGYYPVIVTVRPVQGSQGTEGLLLVTFQDSGQDILTPHPPETAAEESVAKQLESELKATEEDLQSTIEELESSNEELKVSNEEVMSMNEELHSANEELETSKEELQSLNEELTTVNNQLQEKVADLETANNDMANVLNCTEVAIIFLDRQFRIKRYTDPATRLFNLIATDLNRPISHITPKFPDSTLQHDIEQVLRTLTPQETQVQTPDGCWWNRRITLYRTLEKCVDGVVLTFTEITQIRRASEQARRLATILLDSNDAVTVHDFDGKITAWNRGAEQLYGFSEAEALQMNADQIIPEELRGDVRTYWERLRQGERVDSWETQRRTKDGRILDVWITSTALKDEAGRPIAIAKTARDITEQKRAQRALQKSQGQLGAILHTAADAIITIDGKGIIQSVNAATERMFGYSAVEMIGQNVKMLMTPAYRNEHDRYRENYAQTGIKKIIGIGREVVAQRKDGSTFPVDLAVSEVEHLKLFTGIIRDISRRKELEHEVVEIASLEQRRIGQDLHDDCGQQLTAIGMLVDGLAESLASHTPADLKVVNKIGQGINNVLREVRSIARGLALAEVDPEDLPAALAELASRLSETSAVRCVFQGEKDAHIKDSVQATHIYHIAQEACTNALKHAKAKNVEIRLQSTNDTFVLQIEDDGIGISKVARQGLGTRIMRNRASVIGANLTLEPAQPRGTLVTCILKERADAPQQ
jgi:two-component system CheB/CheR fusion protein